MPIVPMRMKKNKNIVGIQNTEVWLKLKNELKAKPVMLTHIPTLEIIAIGFLPNLSERIATANVIMHRINPMITVLKNSSIATPASSENCAA